MSYLLHLVIHCSMFGIIAISLNMVVGYCGLLTIAHAAFFAMGGYAYALASMHLGWGFLPASVLGGVIAAIASLVLSLSAWKFRGDFFVLISLAIQVILFSIYYNWYTPGHTSGTWANLTNGPLGLAGIPRPSFFGLHLTTSQDLAILAVLLFLFCVLAAWLLLSSPWGRLLKCMRDDELALRGLGKSVRTIKTYVFSISCGMVGMAGALYASYVGYLDPSEAALEKSILVLCMVIVGGTGNLRGPIVGAFILVAIPELLKFIDLSDVKIANVRLMIYGALLVIMMQFRPQGIAGEYRVE